MTASSSCQSGNLFDIRFQCFRKPAKISDDDGTHGKDISLKFIVLHLLNRLLYRKCTKILKEEQFKQIYSDERNYYSNDKNNNNNDDDDDNNQKIIYYEDNCNYWKSA